MSKVLIVAEHADGKANPSTAKCVACASAIPDAEIHIVVLSDDSENVANELAAIE